MLKETTDYSLPDDRMPEAEVSLQLAFYLLSLPNAGSLAQVAIDGAQIRVHGADIFPIAPFLKNWGWQQVEPKRKNYWQGVYENAGQRLKIHTQSGVGDVVVQVGSQHIRAECKGGPLVKKPGSQEYRILRQALGQIVTVKEDPPEDVLVVAVPLTPRFKKLVSKWRLRPLVMRTGIQIVLVGRDGVVEGLSLYAQCTTSKNRRAS